MTSNGEVACGRCVACLVKRSNEWSFRLFHELANSSSCWFVTLTYDELNVPRADVYEYYPTHIPKKDYIKLYGELPVKAVHPNQMVFSVEDCQKFIKRLRKKFPPGLRYFLAAEYGPSSTERPHYHMLLFNVPKLCKEYEHEQQRLEQIITETWNKGFISVERATDTRVIYCAKYSLSQLDRPYYFPRPFILASRRPGIGMNFLNDNIKQYYRNTLDVTGKLANSMTFPLSRYYKNKIFDEEDRLHLKIQFLKQREEYSEAEKEAYKEKIKRKLKKQKLKKW